MGEREGEGARERERRESEAVDKFGKQVQATLEGLVGGEHAGLVGDEHKSQKASTTKAETTANAEPSEMPSQCASATTLLALLIDYCFTAGW